MDFRCNEWPLEGFGRGMIQLDLYFKKFTLLVSGKGIVWARVGMAVTVALDQDEGVQTNVTAVRVGLCSG